MKFGTDVINSRLKASRCYHCLGFGHVTAHCGGPDRSRCCWRCGIEGHTVAACTGKSRCYLCAERKEKPRTDYLPETMRCAALREADSKRKPGEVSKRARQANKIERWSSAYCAHRQWPWSNANAVPGLYVWRGNRTVLSLVGIASAESHTACVNAFSLTPEKKEKKTD